MIWVVVLASVAVVSGLPRARTCRRCSAVQEGPFYFTQRVDHFDPSNSATFQQKYYTIPEATPGAPFFLYISGEAPLGGFEEDEVLKYASALGAGLWTLEHRFYGSSLPEGSNFTTPNLRLLTVEQALAGEQAPSSLPRAPLMCLSQIWPVLPLRLPDRAKLSRLAVRTPVP
jgi:hypothetical protein